MRVLLTGGCGFIGSAVVRHLIGSGDASVVNVDKMSYAASEEALEGALGHTRHTLVRADITDAAAMREVFATHQPDAVMHLAAESHVDRSIDGPGRVHPDQRGGHLRAAGRGAAPTGRGLDPARARDAFRFHHISTDEVFGALGCRTIRRSPRPRHTIRAAPIPRPRPRSDHLVRAWQHTYGLPGLSSANTTNNYGPWQFPEKLIPLVTLNALEDQPLPVYGDGSNQRDWLYRGRPCRGIGDRAGGTRREPGQHATRSAPSSHGQQPVQVVHAICAIAGSAFSPDPAGPRSRTADPHYVTDRPGP